MHSLTSETPPLHGSRYTEEDWNNDSTIENGQFYPLSKVEPSTIFHLTIVQAARGVQEGNLSLCAGSRDS